jgi:hypothetical protein
MNCKYKELGTQRILISVELSISGKNSVDRKDSYIGILSHADKIFVILLG